MTKPKVSRPTSVVQRAALMYPDALKAATSYIGGVPYMKERIDPRTADRRLVEMTPEQMYQLSITDPVAAEQAAARIQTLDARAAALPPYPDDYEE